MSDMIRKIADAKADFDNWKEVRRGYLTSSEVFGWRGVDVPDWYAHDTNPDTILDGKLGVDKTFDTYSETSMAHGSYDEEHIQEKFSDFVGCFVSPDNGLYHNERWSHLAASIDGFGRSIHLDPPKVATVTDALYPTRPELSQDRELADYLREYIDTNLSVFITEVKKSTSSKWQTTTPIYYISQVKTQLAILDLPYAVIMAETIMRNPEKKWINNWDFRAYIIERDPEWDEVLDEMNEDFKNRLTSLRA